MKQKDASNNITETQSEPMRWESKHLQVIIQEETSRLEVWFVFLNLHHQMMNVDELGAHRHTAKRGLGEDLMETMIILNKLCERPLVKTKKIC